MTKYTMPELEIRMYKTDSSHMITTSDPAGNNGNDLFTGDKEDFFPDDD